MPRRAFGKPLSRREGDRILGYSAEFERYDRGRHPAQLNFGDCMAYAVAKLSGEPLLCTGKGFPKTDLALA